jgi:hypothetical protein
LSRWRAFRHWAKASTCKACGSNARVNARGQSYSGNITIEANGHASDVTKRPAGTYARQSGYVTVSGSKMEIVFTSVVADPAPYSPDHFYCTIQSDQALSCSNTDVAGSNSNTFAVVRVGAPLRGK